MPKRYSKKSKKLSKKRSKKLSKKRSRRRSRVKSGGMLGQMSREDQIHSLLEQQKIHKQKEFDELPPFRKDPKRWGARKLPNSLASLMRLTDFHAPADYAPGKTSTKFKTVCDALEKRGQTYSLLTKAQKKKATEVLKHNQFDVEAMRVLTEIIYNTDCDLFYRQIKPLFE